MLTYQDKFPGYRLEILGRKELPCLISPHKTVPHGHRLIGAENDEDKGQDKLPPEDYAEFSDEQFAVGRFELRQLKGSGQDQHSESSCLERIVVFKAAGEED